MIGGGMKALLEHSHTRPLNYLCHYQRPNRHLHYKRTSPPPCPAIFPILRLHSNKDINKVTNRMQQNYLVSQTLNKIIPGHKTFNHLRLSPTLPLLLCLTPTPCSISVLFRAIVGLSATSPPANDVARYQSQTIIF